MRKFILTAAFLAVLAAPGLSGAHEAPSVKGSVKGGFEVAGFLSTGAGWQRFSNDPITERAWDGSFAGVLGSVIPEAMSSTLPSPGEDNTEFFTEVAEVDFIKSFGDKARLRADVLFGRINSGSWVSAPGVTIEMAYLSVRPFAGRNIEFAIGRFGTPAGFETYEPFNNDTVSWSILTRSMIYPLFFTGAQVSADLSDHLSLIVGVGNGVLNDTTVKFTNIPAGLVSLGIHWGPEEQQNTVTITPYLGPEAGGNRPLSCGADVTATFYPLENLQLGFEGSFHRDNGDGAPNTNYAEGLVNLHWDLSDKFYLFARYAFARQFAAGTGVINLTGAKQSIHEASVGFGYWVADGIRLKFENRTDVVVPSGAATQTAPGAAMGLACAF